MGSAQMEVAGVMKRKSLEVESRRKEWEERHEIREKIIFAQEIERRRLASDIHDGIIQSLANIYYRIQACERLLSKDVPKAKQDLGEIESLVKEGIVEARRLVDSFRPPILDDIGLVPAIEKYLRRVGKENPLSVTLLVDNPDFRMSPQAEAAIYRVVQEAVFNAQRHAGATHVEVKIARDENLLMLEITDNGQGFDLAAVNAEGDNWGLIGMQERAEVLDGSLEIISKIGRGTTVVAKLPLTS